MARGGPSVLEMRKAVKAMKMGKRPGEDRFAAESLRYGGKRQEKAVFGIVRRMWGAATRAEEGKEADDWPSEWKSGLTIPMWKRKGNKKDKSTWRG